MLNVYTKRVRDRLEQLVEEIQNSRNSPTAFHDRLRGFKNFCENTPVLMQLIYELPLTQYDSSQHNTWVVWPPGIRSYAMRWDAIKQWVADVSSLVVLFDQSDRESQSQGLNDVTKHFVVPFSNFLSDRLASASAMLYALTRYKRWVEWFEADRLRELYKANTRHGEDVLDESLRRFLFESGIDYPYSKPASPRGEADVVAKLETDDPLVLEVKVWDSEKGYKENRVRDGLRQVMDYAARYGKDREYVVVFNLDKHHLAFKGSNAGEWPPSIEHGGRTYFFIDVHIAKQRKPISQRDKGKAPAQEIDLAELLTNTLAEVSRD